MTLGVSVSAMYRQITRCRVCGNSELIPVLSLGIQSMTGVFPRPEEADSVPAGPLSLVKCHGGPGVCGLLQLEHSYDPAEMYGENYGYRSGLNTAMINHLRGKVEKICREIELVAGDIVIDVGSNDGTSLAAFSEDLFLIGIDPTAQKFRSYYKPHIHVVPDFFSQRAIVDVIGSKKAKVIISHSMFYDLEDPVEFAREVRSVLADDGIWVFEQSYMPSMLARTAYDTVCHEHVEYYGLHQISWILEKVGFRATDVEFNDTNGGSFSVIATPAGNANRPTQDTVGETLLSERQLRLLDLDPYVKFESTTRQRRDELSSFVTAAREKGGRICGAGASTKGNTLLQFTGLNSSHIESIAEINPDKFGRVTPGSKIPIVNQPDVLRTYPDYLLVLPWHFRDFFLSSELFARQTLLFPLPIVEVVARH